MQKIHTLILGILLTTTAYATHKIDSIGIENNKGKKVIIYKVEAKETYYSISKQYNVNYKDLMEFNNNQSLQIGMTLKIPTQMPFIEKTTTSKPNNNVNALTYTIKAKDNLNMLAETYGTTVDEIKKINNLSTSNLQIGQTLLIPKSITGTNRTNPTYTTKTSTIKESSLTHVVKAKENLSFIAKLYNTTIEDIKSLNELSSLNLRIGQILKIPTSTETIVTANTSPVAEVKNTAQEQQEKAAKNGVKDRNIQHVVLANETIYSIAKKYSTTTYQIKTANQLNSNDLRVGQKLTIKNLNPVNLVGTTESAEEGVTIERMVSPTLRGAPSKYGISQIEEKGIATWIEDKDLDSTKMLVLHRTAPVGTVIKITNPMTNKSTFAKVVGKFIENDNTKDVTIVMTKAVADAVGALDKRFACSLSYGTLENEQ